MSALSNTYELSVLDHLFNNVALTSPTTVYLGLFTSDPTDAGSGTEVSTSGTAYARQSISFAAASSGAVTTDADITFPTATAAYGTVTHIGIFDHVSNAASTSMVAHGQLDTSKAIDGGDTFVVTAGNLTVSLD